MFKFKDDGEKKVLACDTFCFQLVAQALDCARDITQGGKGIDDHQVLVERVSYAATETRAARETVAALRDAKGEGRVTQAFETTGAAAVALLTTSIDNFSPAVNVGALERSVHVVAAAVTAQVKLVSDPSFRTVTV